MKNSLKKFIYTATGYLPGRRVGGGTFGDVFLVCQSPEGVVSEHIVMKIMSISDHHEKKEFTHEVLLASNLGDAGIAPAILYSGSFPRDDGVTLGIICMQRFDMDAGTFLHQHPGKTESLNKAMIDLFLRMAQVSDFVCIDLKPNHMLLNTDSEENITKLVISDFSNGYCNFKWSDIFDGFDYNVDDPMHLEQIYHKCRPLVSPVEWNTADLFNFQFTPKKQELAAFATLMSIYYGNIRNINKKQARIIKKFMRNFIADHQWVMQAIVYAVVLSPVRWVAKATHEQYNTPEEGPVVILQDLFSEECPTTTAKKTKSFLATILGAS